MMGIPRRGKWKTSKMYQNLKKGIIPDELTYLYEVGKKIGDVPIRAQMLFGEFKHKEHGIPTDENSRMYDRTKYKFLLDAEFEISEKCCNVMKKEPSHRYSKETGRKPITGQTASESMLRTQKWLQYGCNGFDMGNPISNPMSFWLEQDILLYIVENRLEICSVYGEVVVDYAADNQVEGQMSLSDFGVFDKERQSFKCTGCQRTGCCLCTLGAHREKDEESRFVRLKETHPGMYRLLDVVKNNGWTYRQAIEWVNEHNGKGEIIKL